jgi:hypothetical protein
MTTVDIAEGRRLLAAPFDWDKAEPELIEAFTETIADNPPDNALMVTVEWAFEVLTALSDRGYVLVPRAEALLAGTPDLDVPGLLIAWRRTKDFLRDRMLTSGRSDVNINAVLRVMNGAFEDREAPDGR